MRTNSPDIKDVWTVIRNWNQKDSLAKLLLPIHSRKNSKKTFCLYHKKSNITEATWFKHFVSKIENGKIPIILTWKNSTADAYNKIIRKHVHKINDLNNYVVGDYAMFNNFYLSPEDGTSFYTANMIKILEIKNEQRLLFDWTSLLIDEPKTAIDKAYNLLVKKLSKQKNQFDIDIFTVERKQNIMQPSPDRTYIVQTIHRDDSDTYKEYIETTQEHIEVFFKRYKSKTHTNKLWDAYHKKLKDPYAILSFGYSITTHKSQGSTFNDVYVDVDDISQNPDLNEMQHCLYTSATRASEYLGFLLG